MTHSNFALKDDSGLLEFMKKVYLTNKAYKTRDISKILPDSRPIIVLMRDCFWRLITRLAQLIKFQERFDL